MLKWTSGELVDYSIVSQSEVVFSQWREQGFTETGADGEGSVLSIGNDVDLGEVDLMSRASTEALFERYSAIMLEFPYFKDGRAYSQARRLREDFGFEGDIIARGDIGVDQLLFMIRSGINCFDVDLSQRAEFTSGIEAFSAFYQRGADPAQPVWCLRALQTIAA